MTFDQIVNAVYEGVSLADLEALVSELASEKAAELVSPSSEDKDLVCYCAPARCHGHALEKDAAWAVETLKGPFKD